MQYKKTAHQLDAHLSYLVKKMDYFFKQAEHYKDLGVDGAAQNETIKNALIGAAYKEAFEKLCDAIGVNKKFYLPNDEKEK